MGLQLHQLSGIRQQRKKVIMLTWFILGALDFLLCVELHGFKVVYFLNILIIYIYDYFIYICIYMYMKNSSSFWLSFKEVNYKIVLILAWQYHIYLDIYIISYFYPHLLLTYTTLGVQYFVYLFYRSMIAKVINILHTIIFLACFGFGFPYISKIYK